jgi:hypothetical protein
LPQPVHRPDSNQTFAPWKWYVIIYVQRNCLTQISHTMTKRVHYIRFNKWYMICSMEYQLHTLLPKLFHRKSPQN